MIDISEYGFQFRGYPVTIASEGVMTLLSRSSRGVTAELGSMLRTARDTAKPDEPSGWIFESSTDGTTVWIERFGGMRSQDRHEGAQWSVYLPAER